MAAAAWVVLACSSSEPDRPPPWSGEPEGGAGPALGEDGVDLEPECEGPPSPDTSVLCGAQTVPVIVQKPTLYFVVDVSGSMEEPLAEPDATAEELARAPTKLEASQEALLTLTLEHGHRIHYGMATFPGPDTDDVALLGCAAGREIFEVREGDPLLCLNRPGGDVQDAFTEQVEALEPVGGTPLSPTLGELSETILALPRPASVVLLTDGAPNCNLEASCGADSCIPNLEGGALPSGACDDSFNCCDSSQVEESDLPFIGVPEAQCIDGDASLEWIERFAEEGISTFVVGVPGSEAYAGLMAAFAEAGGTAREDDVAYYDVRDVEELSESLAAIGAQTSQGCVIEAAEQVVDPDLLNVYFDAAVVQKDAANGWTSSGQEVTFHGDACDEIEAGLVVQVHLISGCPSVVVK